MFTTILSYLALVPQLITAITAIEQAIPMSGAGTAKVEMVKQIITTVDGAAVQSMPLIEKIIGIIVSTFNALGIFKSSTPAK